MNEDNQKLWDQYCRLRDALFRIHARYQRMNLRTPKSVWLFVVGRNERYRRFTPPAYKQQARMTAWIESALVRCREAAGL